MKIECQLKPTKDGNNYYLFIPLLEKRIFLEAVEQKLIKLVMDKNNEENKKSDTK